MKLPATQARTFPLALEPLGLKKIKSGESHMLPNKVGFQCKFPAKCFLPKANSQKFLYNSTSHSACDCSLTLCASKTEFWQQQQQQKTTTTKVFVPCFKVMQLSPVISWQFQETLCLRPVSLLSYCGNSCQAQNLTLSSEGEEGKHLKIKN